MYSELLKLFDVREVANVVQDTLGSLPAIMHVDDALQAVKLQCISKTVESQLYTNPGGCHVSLPRGCRSSSRKDTGNCFLQSLVCLDGRIKLSSGPVQKRGY